MEIFARAYHNVTTDEQDRPVGMMDGYQATHEVTLTAELLVTANSSGFMACAEVFRLLNIGDDPTHGTPDPQAVAYRAGGNRSLSVGDVVEVDGVFYSCDRFGWGRLAEAPRIVRRDMPGTHYLSVDRFGYCIYADNQPVTHWANKPANANTPRPDIAGVCADHAEERRARGDEVRRTLDIPGGNSAPPYTAKLAKHRDNERSGDLDCLASRCGCFQ